MLTIKETSIISMHYRVINISKYVNHSIYGISVSQLEWIISNTNRGWDTQKSLEQQFTVGLDKLEKKYKYWSRIYK